MQQQDPFIDLSIRFSTLELAFKKQEEILLVQEKLLNQKDEIIAHVKFQNTLLQQQLDQIKKMVFGSKHERVEFTNPGQLSLDMGLEQTAQPVPSTEVISYTRTKKDGAQKPVRSALPAILPRQVIEIEPEEDTTGMKLISHEITEQLEMTPAKFYVKQYKRAKYARPQGQGVVIGKLPELTLPKAIAGSSVLTHILIGKYVDHLPLDRQRNQFKRIGMNLADSTIGGWVKDSIELLKPLHDKNASLLLASGYIQNDETPIKVLDSEKKGKTHRGFFWVSHSPQTKIVVFNYDKSRAATFPSEFLKDYRGYLQTDGWEVYERFGKQPGITLLSCMAHARRYFHDALGNDKKHAKHFIEQLQLLYKLEQDLRDENASEELILERRKEVAVPVLDQLFLWLKETLPQTTPAELIGKAIRYALPRWDKLMQYTTNGLLQIDNNLVENQIRPVALGRKNYLFCGSHESAQRAAIIYSLLGTCKLNGINPHEWLNDVLIKLPSRKINNIDDLLPQNWKPEVLGVL